MNKSTITTYSIFSCSMHICSADEEIIFNDHSSSEILSIEGVPPTEIRSAIKCYVQNVALRRDDKPAHIEWLKEMHAEVSASLALLEGATKD